MQMVFFIALNHTLHWLRILTSGCFASTHPAQTKLPWDLEMDDDPLNMPRVFLFGVGTSSKTWRNYKQAATKKNAKFGQI